MGKTRRFKKSKRKDDYENENKEILRKKKLKRKLLIIKQLEDDISGIYKWIYKNPTP